MRQECRAGRKFGWRRLFLDAARILIVDDEKFVRRTISRVLSSEGFSIFEASNGPDALRMVQEQPFDLMILDIVMEVV